MSVSKFLKNTGWLALAASMVATAMPASAQDRRGDRGDRGSAQQAQPGGGQGGDRRDFARQRQAEQRGQQAQQRATQPARQAAAAAPARQGNWQGRQTDRRAQPPVVQPVRQATAPVIAQRDRQGRDARRGQRPGDNLREQIRRDDRERTYTNQLRTYARDADRREAQRRDNDRWRNDGRRDNYQRWDRRWRDNNRYDYNRYRSTNRSVFRIGVYYSPYRNYSYRRLGIGYSLDSLFFGSRYWINDPWQYRLPAVYGPYRWVRYYNDVLLVDIYSGEVVDVIYDFFW